MNRQSFTDRLAPNWGWFTLRGALCVVYLIGLAILNPLHNSGAGALAGLTGAFLIFMGVCQLVPAFMVADQHRPWGWLAAAGITSIAVGIFSLFAPVSDVWTWAAWAFFTGAFELVAGIRLETEGNRFGMILAGLLTFILGCCIGAVPTLSANYLGACMGSYAFLLGCTEFVFGAQLKTVLGPPPPAEPLPRRGALQPDVGEHVRTIVNVPTFKV